jgi:NAD-dependent SIR2 family protein deacetylase
MSIKISEFITGLKTKQFTKVIVASGAGISVAAGLRDYRSKDTGLYDQLKKNNMTHPEKVYDIHVFRKNPDLYYQVCREFGTHNLNLKPTVAH